MTPEFILVLLVVGGALVSSGVIFSTLIIFAKLRAERAARAEMYDRTVFMENQFKADTVNAFLEALDRSPLDVGTRKELLKIIHPSLAALPSSTLKHVSTALQQPSEPGQSRYLIKLMVPEVDRIRQVIQKINEIQARVPNELSSSKARGKVISCVRKWSVAEFRTEKPPTPRTPSNPVPSDETVTCRICTDLIPTKRSTCPYCSLYTGLWMDSPPSPSDGSDFGSDKAHDDVSNPRASL